MPTSKKDFEWAAEYVRGMRKAYLCNEHDECKKDEEMAAECKGVDPLARVRCQCIENAFVDFFNHTGSRFDVSRFREACRG